ncbi:MAG: electron transfer flavoprotein subunit alpha/FixB family protein [Gaiellaceae bacterium]
MRAVVVAEHVRGELRPITLELISAARSLGGPVDVAVIAAEPSAFADAVNVEGVDEILVVKVDADEFENDVYQQVVEQLIAERSPDVVVLGFTVSSMGYGPALAAKLGTGFASDVFAVRDEGGELVAERSFYGAKVNGEIEFPGHDRAVLLIRATAWPPAEGAGSASVTEVSVEPTPSRARHRDWVEVQAGDVDITTADLLLSVGRGIGDKDNLEQFEGLAEAMGATLSSSRPLVDAGWMPSARQVGQSGSGAAPRRHEDERHDHRRQHRSGGGDLQRRGLRRGG